jgi:hypothetical protein
LTTYRGEAHVQTELIEIDADADTYCTNDLCPALEVDLEPDEDIPGQTYAQEVRRVAWNCGWHRPSRPTYSCGGEPAYADRPECPYCHEAGEEL